MISYTATVTDANNIEIEITGIVRGSNPLDPEIYMDVGRAVFLQLTGGAARYGAPGRGGCTGPYNIKMISLVRS